MTVKNKGKNSRLRAFFTTGLATGFLLLLAAGILLVDYNTRLVGFGESSLRLDITEENGQVQLDLFGRKTEFTLSETVQDWADSAWTLLPPGLKTLFWLYEGEYEGTAGALEWAGES